MSEQRTDKRQHKEERAKRQLADERRLRAKLEYVNREYGMDYELIKKSNREKGRK